MVRFSYCGSSRMLTARYGRRSREAAAIERLVEILAEERETGVLWLCRLLENKVIAVSLETSEERRLPRAEFVVTFKIVS